MLLPSLVAIVEWRFMFSCNFSPNLPAAPAGPCPNLSNRAANVENDEENAPWCVSAVVMLGVPQLGVYEKLDKIGSPKIPWFKPWFKHKVPIFLRKSCHSRAIVEASSQSSTVTRRVFSGRIYGEFTNRNGVLSKKLRDIYIDGSLKTHPRRCQSTPAFIVGRYVCSWLFLPTSSTADDSGWG